MSSTSRRHHQRREERESGADRLTSSHSHHQSSGRHRHDGKRDDRSRSRSPDRHRRHHESRRREGETRDERRERKRRERNIDDEFERSDSRAKEETQEVRQESKHFRSGNTAHAEMPSEDTASKLPTSESLSLTSSCASFLPKEPKLLPQQSPTVSYISRDNWMLSGVDSAEEAWDEYDPSKTTDYFSTMATYSREKKPVAEKPNPDQLKVSSREINAQFAQGKHIDDYEKTTSSSPQPGGPGYQWRMMKLKRVYEAAEEEGRDIQEVAIERFGSLEGFNEARAERQFLDDQQGRRTARQHHNGHSAAGRNQSSSTSSGRPPAVVSSRQSFRRPGDSAVASPSSTASPSLASRRSSFQQSGFRSNDPSKPATPIPSVFAPSLSKPGSKIGTPNHESEKVASANSSGASAENDHLSVSPLSSVELNKLSAKVMKAEMMGTADAPELRERLNRETARAQGGGDQGFASGVNHQVGATQGETESYIQVLPTLDARGRLYDVGNSKTSEDAEVILPGNRRKDRRLETRDAKTGELLRYNADDDKQTLADLVRQERFGAGSADQKNVDAEMASRITADQAFKDNIDYMDENVERLAQKKMKTDYMKRQYAIQDFARTKKALDTCQYCWQDEGAKPPRANIISSGTRSYLALPSQESMTDGHCLIVPMQHHLSMLEADDDSWEEIKNFMKCLMQMAASRKQSVIFFETVKSLKQQRHTVIEAVPVDNGLFQELPGYFKQSIVSTGDEWSQNKKLVEFSSSRPFRRSMVPQLPYFMVQFDYKGERGYGHIIEDGDGFDGPGGGDGLEMAESSKGGGDFPAWFAAEIIGNLLDLEPRRWRKPRRLHGAEQQTLRDSFLSIWTPYDWTKLLDTQ